MERNIAAMIIVIAAAVASIAVAAVVAVVGQYYSVKFMNVGPD